MTDKQLRIFAFASIISADNDMYSEEVKQEIMRRHRESNDWAYILDPIEDVEHKDKLIKFFKDKRVSIG